MGILLESSLVELIGVLLVMLWIFYHYVTQPYIYWQKRGVPWVPPTFFLGSLPEVSLGLLNIGMGYERCYRQFKGERFFGIIDNRAPTLVIRDPDLIKHVMTKDFRCFTDRVYIPETLKHEYIIHHLFNLGGQDWRKMRLTLAPTFTSGKMKTMFSLIEKCSDQLQEHMDSLVQSSSVFDIKDILARFTMDIIASCAFGLDINTLENKNCEFYKVSSTIFRTTKLRILRRMWYSFVPMLSKIYTPPVVSVEITEFFTRIIRETVVYREENSVNRNDFLDLLIKIKQNKSVLDAEEKHNGQPEFSDNQTNKKSGLTLEEITAQSFIFFGAGFETASSTASFCLYELACNPKVQDKLYQEIEEVLKKHGGKPTYQALQEMKYMDQVINETLRRYASLSVLNRISTESYTIPDSKLTIEKGTKITIPIYAIHHDPEYYPEPYKFDPERFTPDKVKERHPYVHLPFGEGPRMCIGMRFGLMQTKIALATMVNNYKFCPSAKTEIPIKINKKSFVTLPDNEVLLQVVKRQIGVVG